MFRIFIDGAEGTTGLRIHDRLSARRDIELLTLDSSLRKDPAARREMLNTADISFLCLPDEAAIEAVAMLENENARIIDTSTAHRTNAEWSYGFPELSAELKEKIIKGRFTAVPGCHASGFEALIYPLVKRSIISPSLPISCFSVTGYSGGGKKMIAEYNDENRDVSLGSPRQYALGQTHKHLKEMQYITGLELKPVFSPVVADFYSGICLTVPLHALQLSEPLSVAELREVYSEHYASSEVVSCSMSDDVAALPANALSGKDSMVIGVYGNEERIILTATYDNLGKGASGAAVQCMNLMLGLTETTGLEL
ncbi:MAG: N-acetyl-gamma-glutamyl-phosphate reductase [Clostridiales bacterium]|nr:N-acetyl-gamma-glutamyl-phosphate reductase [Clostridiales bacterium]